jgi:hypothetical protein
MLYIHDFALIVFLFLYGLALKPTPKAKPAEPTDAPKEPNPTETIPQDLDKLLSERESIHQKMFQITCTLNGGVEAGRALELNREIAVQKIRFVILSAAIQELSEN